jgi:ATP-dependent Clp protease ATP-binding subunit ClpB
MNAEKYTERVRGFIQSAQTYALAEGHPQFSPEHILKVLLDDDSEGMAASLIERAGGRPADARLANEAALPRPCRRSPAAMAQLYLSQPLAKVLSQTAEDAAKKAGDSFVTVERLPAGDGDRAHVEDVGDPEECRPHGECPQHR